MEKYLLIFMILPMIACSKTTTTQQEYDWTEESQLTYPAELEIKPEEVLSKVMVKDVSVEFASEYIAGLEVDQSFVKVQKRGDRPLRAQALLQKARVSSLKLALWQRASKKKEEALQKIVQADAAFKNRKVEDFQLKLSEEEGLLEAKWFLQYSNHLGELWQAVYSYDLVPLQDFILGSRYETISAWAYPRGPKAGIIEEVKLFDLLKGENLVSKALKVGTATEFKVEVSGQPLQYVISDGRFDQVQTFFIAQRAFDWFSTKMNIQVQQPLDMQVHMGFPGKTNTAFYYNGKIRLGAGDDEVYTKIPWDSSLVSHEVSHYIIDLLARLPNEGEGGSLNEAYADYFSSMINLNPKLGEASYLKAPFRRRIDVVKKRQEKNGSLYGDSLIVSSLMWEVTQIFGEKKGIEMSLQTLRGLTPGSQFDDFKKEYEKASLQVLNEGEILKFNSVLRERGWM